MESKNVRRQGLDRYFLIGFTFKGWRAKILALLKCNYVAFPQRNNFPNLEATSILRKH